jgi:antitoxin component YwqK of YwqJK toxin-antitoxin module
MFGEAKLYYPSGQLKSQIKYNEARPKQWTDYYPSGKIQYEEKMNRAMEYYEYQKYYYESGTPSKTILLTDKKKMEFSFTEYHPNGTVKTQGHRIFVKESSTYFDNGEWTYFDESGNKTKSEKFDRGVKI